jgi:soluble lytic murein transglycosylase-like protein
MSIFTLLMNLLLAIYTASPERSNALRHTAPTYLTTDEQAAAHLTWSALAGEAFSVDQALLLSLAWFESRYQADAVTREPGGRWSCGVMTPVPHAEPCAADELTLVSGYTAGARHLRTWMDVCHNNERCAVLGYAGGYALIGACARGERVDLRGSDACVAVPYARLGRAAWIRKALKRAESRSMS